MKKNLMKVLALTLLASLFAISASAKVMYATDGRMQWVPASDVEENKAVDWYEFPVTALFAEDGTAEVVPTQAVGFYKSVVKNNLPGTVMYNMEDGSVELISENEVLAYKAAGWCEYPVGWYEFNYPETRIKEYDRYVAPTAYSTLKQYLLEKGSYDDNTGMYDSLAYVEDDTITQMVYDPQDGSISVVFENIDVVRDQSLVAVLTLTEEVSPYVTIYVGEYDEEGNYGFTSVFEGVYKTFDVTALSSSYQKDSDAINYVNTVYKWFDKKLGELTSLNVKMKDFDGWCVETPAGYVSLKTLVEDDMLTNKDVEALRLNKRVRISDFEIKYDIVTGMNSVHVK